MSEQEENGLTLQGLAQRLETLEQAEAGTGQTGEEPAAEFVGPASRGEQEYEGLTLQALARRLEVLEHENAALRQQALDEAEARDVSTFDEVRCNVLRVADHAFLKGGGLSSDNYIPSIGDPQAGVTANAVQPGGIGVTGGGLVGVRGWGFKKPGDTEDSVGVKGEGDDFGVWGRSFRADFWGVVGRNPIGGGVIGQGVVGVRGEGGTYGGYFQGGKAQLKLLPASAAGKPTTGEHTKGELYMDSEATLFVCTADGTPGSWKRFQTTPAP